MELRGDFMSFAFQFKHKIKGVHKMYFDEMFSLLSVDERSYLNEQFLLNNFSEDSLNKLLDIRLRYNSNVEELRVSEDHFLFWSKGTLGHSTIMIIPLCEIEYCYYSEHISNANTFYFGFIFKSGKKQEFNFIHNKQLRSVFEKINTLINNGFKTPSNYSLNQENGMFIFKYSKGAYYINKNQIYHTSKKTLFKKETTQLIIPNIQDIIWCYQWYDNDDNVDFHTLSLYLLNSRKPIDIQLGASSADYVFDIVLVLKENVPHLLYGPHSEYEKLFDRSPAELMTLARSKANN